MSDNVAERRRFKRFTVDIRAEIQFLGEDGGNQTVSCVIINISEGGMLLKTVDPVATIGHEIRVRIPGREGLDLTATVRQTDPIEMELQEEELDQVSSLRWVDPVNASFGVEFSDVTPEKRKYIKKLLELYAGE